MVGVSVSSQARERESTGAYSQDGHGHELDLKIS